MFKNIKTTITAGALGAAFGLAIGYTFHYDEYDTNHYCQTGNNIATLEYGDDYAEARYYHMHDDKTIEHIATETSGATGGNPKETHDQITQEKIQAWCDEGIIYGVMQTIYQP